MLLNLKNLPLVENRQGLTFLPSGKLLINTINAHSYNTAQQDLLFAEALRQGDVLIPDGASIVKACCWLNAKSKPKERITGWDLFMFEMEKLNHSGGKCFFGIFSITAELSGFRNFPVSGAVEQFRYEGNAGNAALYQHEYSRRALPGKHQEP